MAEKKDKQVSVRVPLDVYDELENIRWQERANSIPALIVKIATEYVETHKLRGV